jgi:hypothetical protein
MSAPMIRSKVLHRHQGKKKYELETSMSSACRLLLGFLFGLLTDPEDGGSIFFRNSNRFLPEYIV